MRERKSYREIILENIDYDILTQDEKLDRDRLDSWWSSWWIPSVLTGR